ncbi:MAG TPA: archease [Planctomycetaceae bacterium]|nr:archease [Planctomycetaceae bacterium]
MYETFDHTADLGLRIEAATLEKLFEEAARGITAQIVENVAAISPTEEVTIEKQGTETDYLLFDWLDELIYQYEVCHRVFAEFEIKLTAEGFTATLRGEPIDREKHLLSHEVKAVTYHGFVVEQTEHGWRAELILDI